MSSVITTRFLGERDYGAWRDMVSRSPEGSPYYLPEYLSALCQSTGGTFRLLVAERNGEMLGGVSLYEECSKWGRFVSPRLLLYYNGFVLKPYSGKYPSESVSHRIKILTAIEKALATQQYGRMRLKSRVPFSDARVFLSKGWSASPTYTYVVRIKDLTSAWNLVEPNLRRLIQRSESQGLQFTQDDDFDSFHRMHVETHERKGAPVYLPKEAFRRFCEGLTKQGLLRMYHARLKDGRSISAQVVLLGPHPTSHTVAAAADAKHRAMAATPFLRWKVFQNLSGLGYEANDLTDAELNSVTHFKSQLGGDLEMSLVVRHPDSVRFRCGEGLLRLVRGIYGPASRMTRKIISHPQPQHQEQER